MTPTSEERREVAERLRKTRGIMAFVDTLGIDPDGDWCWADVSRRVADLIDPTCHKVIPSEIEGYVFCSKCGAEIGEYGVPNFCHNCGARVVNV